MVTNESYPAVDGKDGVDARDVGREVFIVDGHVRLRIRG